MKVGPRDHFAITGNEGRELVGEEGKGGYLSRSELRTEVVKWTHVLCIVSAASGRN